MADADISSEAGVRERHNEPAVSDAVRSTEFYEVDDGIVFYDVENPLAWLQADHAIDLESIA